MDVWTAIAPPLGFAAALGSVWTVFLITHACVCVCTLAFALYQLLITSRLKLNFRTMTIACVTLSAAVRLLWLVDPFGFERIYSPIIFILLTRVSHSVTFACMCFVIAMWRRLVVASVTLHRITSVITIGHYKHTLAAVCLLLAVTAAISVLSGAGIVPGVVAQAIITATYGLLTIAIAVAGTVAAVQFHDFLLRSFSSSTGVHAGRASAPSSTPTTSASAAAAVSGRSCWAIICCCGTGVLSSRRGAAGRSVMRTRSRRSLPSNTLAVATNPASTTVVGVTTSMPASAAAAVGDVMSARAPARPSTTAPPQPSRAEAAPPVSATANANLTRAVRARVYVGFMSLLAIGWGCLFGVHMASRTLSPSAWCVHVWYSCLLEQAALLCVLATVWLKPTRAARGIPSARSRTRTRAWAYAALLAAKLKGVSWDSSGPQPQAYKEVWEDAELVRAARVRQAIDAGRPIPPESAAADATVPPAAAPNDVSNLLRSREVAHLLIERQARELERVAAERDAAAAADRIAVRATLEYSRSHTYETPAAAASAAQGAVARNPLHGAGRAARFSHVLPPSACVGADDSLPPSLLADVMLDPDTPPGENMMDGAGSLDSATHTPPPSSAVDNGLDALSPFADRFSPEGTPTQLRLMDVDVWMLGAEPDSLDDAVNVGNGGDGAMTRVMQGVGTSQLAGVAAMALGPQGGPSGGQALRDLGVPAADAALIQGIIRANAADLAAAANTVANSAARLHAAATHREPPPQGVINPMRAAVSAAAGQDDEELPAEFMSWLQHEWAESHPRGRAVSEDAPGASAVTRTHAAATSGAAGSLEGRGMMARAHPHTYVSPAVSRMRTPVRAVARGVGYDAGVELPSRAVGARAPSRPALLSSSSSKPRTAV